MAPLELVLPDRRRFPLDAELIIGRSQASTVRLADPSVSRVHARIRPGAAGDAVLEDAGSTYGTWLDGRRVNAPTLLRAGARIRVGEQELVVARRPGDGEAGHTVVVPTAEGTARIGGYPRLRSGYALKRLEAAEGERRWMLKDLRSGRFVRLSSRDAELLPLIDGSRSVEALIAAAERQQGEGGPERLTVLLAALAERGLLSGVAGTPDAPAAGGWRRLLAPRTRAWAGAGAFFARLYAGGGGRLLDAARARSAGRARVRRARRVRGADRWALRDAVRRGEQGGHRRRRVRAGATRGRCRPRDGARARDGVLRPAGALGRP